MTPRERVIKTLKHETPDVIPLDLGGTESSGFTALSYNRLRDYLGLGPGKTQVFDVYQQVVKIENDLRKILRPDTVPLLLEPLRWKPFELPDGSACRIPEKWNPERDEKGGWIVKNQRGVAVARMPLGGFYFEPVHAPLAHIQKSSKLDAFSEEIASFDWPFYADESLKDMASRAKKLHEKTNLAVVANLQLHLMAAGQQLRGYESFMLDLIDNKELAHGLLSRLTEAYIKRCDSFLKVTRKFIQVVLVNDDLGTQAGPMMSVETYREMIWPYQKRLFENIKKKSGAFVLFHSCGSVYRFIPYLIEAGVDALNPVQVSAAEMDTHRLKTEFGGELTFWGGGCDTQRILIEGTKRQIEDEVKRRIDDLAPGGGFVFTQVHNVQPDVPPRNFMIMWEAFNKFKDY